MASSLLSWWTFGRAKGAQRAQALRQEEEEKEKAGSWVAQVERLHKNDALLTELKYTSVLRSFGASLPPLPVLVMPKES